MLITAQSPAVFDFRHVGAEPLYPRDRAAVPTMPRSAPRRAACAVTRLSLDSGPCERTMPVESVNCLVGRALSRPDPARSSPRSWHYRSVWRAARSRGRGLRQPAPRTTSCCARAASWRTAILGAGEAGDRASRIQLAPTSERARAIASTPARGSTRRLRRCPTTSGSGTVPPRETWQNRSTTN